MDGRAPARTEPDQAGQRALSLSTAVTLGAPGALPAETSTAASFSGARPVGGSTSTNEPATANATLELWFKTATPGGTLLAFGAGDGSQPTTRSRELYLTPSGRLAFAVRPSGAVGSAATFAASADPVTDGKWHHAAAVDTPDQLLLYVDGDLVASTDATIPAGDPGRWWVGGATPADLVNSAGVAFAGDLDEVAVYPEALTASRISAHVSLGRS